MQSSVYSRLAHLTNPTNYHDDRHIYDNRIIVDSSQAGLGEVGFASSEDERAVYQQAKFGYYLTRLETLIASSCRETRVEASADVPSDAVTIWDEYFADEVKAYLLRVLHGPRAAVIDTWYNDLPVFMRWAAAADTLTSRFSTEAIANALSTALPVCLDEEAEIMRSVTEDAARLAASVQEIRPDAIATARRAPRVADLIRRIEGELALALTVHDVDYEAALTVVARVLRDCYQVKICDFLSVTHGSEGFRVLDLSATSWDAHDIDRVRGEEAVYSVGGGITGSVFLLSRAAPVRWICTNVLPADPRQSKRHALVYRNVYGPVEAFCVVPIYSGSAVIGALRLIEPNALATTNDTVQHGRPNTWPLTTRLELAELSEWLSAVLPMLRVALPGGDDDSALAEVARHPRWLEWASPRFKAALLRDCARIISMRDEHRTVSATLLAGSVDGCSSFERRSKPYPSIPPDREQGPLLGAAGLFGRVLPGAGVFVCPETRSNDAYLTGCVYRSVQATSQLSPAAAASSIGDIRDAALFHIDGDQRVVRVFERGSWSADYYVNEKLGRWQLRGRQGLEDQLRGWMPSSFPVPDLIIRLVTDYAVAYSYAGHGGLLLVASKPPREQIAEDGFYVGQPLSGMDQAQFGTIVAVDGGTWIDFEGDVREAGVIFDNRAAPEAPRGGGARHQVAKSLADAVPEGVVVAISANRPITLFSTDSELPL